MHPHTHMTILTFLFTFYFDFFFFFFFFGFGWALNDCSLKPFEAMGTILSVTCSSFDLLELPLKVSMRV